MQATQIAQKFDIAILGGGAAGSAAAISALFEGASVGVFEKRGLGGGGFCHTPLINNVPGYPEGITGSDLSARTIEHIERLGGTYLPNTTINLIDKIGNTFLLGGKCKQFFSAKQVIIATGVTYRPLEVPGAKKLESRGLFYEVEDALVDTVRATHPTIGIYGAGNSAGQAALFYDKLGATVTMLLRGKDLESSMSQHLIQRIYDRKINLIPQTTITALEGSSSLTAIKTKHVTTQQETTLPMQHLFAMIGGEPPELPEIPFATLEIDHRGYIVTKDQVTSVSGIHAAGDVTTEGAGRILLAQASGVSASIKALQAL